MKYVIDTDNLNNEVIKKVKAGDMLFLNGEIYTARDQAHLRLYKTLKSNKRLPLSLKNKVIYYTGPTPKRKNMAIGSCGPTTSSRMDLYTPALLNAGARILIGKGRRSPKVLKALKRKKALYLIAPAGCGAYLSTKVLRACPVAYKDLKTEAIFKFTVKDFPAIVCVDGRGNCLYKMEGC